MSLPRPSLLCLLALLAPAAALGADAREWSVVSANAEYEAVQAPVGETGCRFEVKRGERTLVWAADRCFATVDDARFLSNDGSRLLVLYAFPAKQGDTPAGMKGVPAVEVFSRGERVARHLVGAFVKDTKPLVNAKRHFYWLEGVLGQSGVPPGPSKAADAIEFTTLDHRSWAVGFDGKVKKIDAPKTLRR